MTISFDYDGTLTNPAILKIAKEIKLPKIITTSRKYSQEVIDFMKEHNFNSVTFTNHQLKYKFLSNADIHIDDDTIEIKEILINTSCIPLHTSDINKLKELI